MFGSRRFGTHRTLRSSALPLRLWLKMLRLIGCRCAASMHLTSVLSRVSQSLLCCFFVRLVGSRICVVTLRADFFVGLCRHKRCPDILRLFVQPWYLSMYHRAGLSPGLFLVSIFVRMCLFVCERASRLHLCLCQCIGEMVGFLVLLCSL